MSEENVEVVRGIVRAFRAAEWDAALSAYATDAELDLSRMPGGGIYHGPAGVREFYTGWIQSWERFEAEPLEFIEAGDEVISVMQISGIGKDSGVPVAMRPADVYTLDGGKVVRQVGYPDASDALEAAGLSE